MDIYAENILDHYKRPRHFGAMADATNSYHQQNRSCGDEMTFYTKIENNRVVDISFEGGGCAISMAAASILSEALIGKSTAEIEALGLEDVKALLGVEITGRRENCALVGLKAVQSAITKMSNI
jgi:nitrogen fixation NifU-like protein